MRHCNRGEAKSRIRGSVSGEAKLRKLQTLLYRLITSPDEMEEVLGREGISHVQLEEIIRSDHRLSSVDRLQVYRNAYFRRLLESLKENYPWVAQILDEVGFEKLVRDYLKQHPPESWSVTYTGQKLPQFLSTSSYLARWPFLADLARLEWVLLEVLLAPDSRSLTRQVLERQPVNRWPTIVLKFKPAVQLLHFDWPVAHIVRLLEDRKPLASVCREPQEILVWKAEDQVYFRAIRDLEFAALTHLAKGLTLAELCEVVANLCREQDTVAVVTRMLVRWADDECLLDTCTMNDDSR